jgi:hypothetical protein
MDSTPLVRCDIQQQATDCSNPNQAETCEVELRATYGGMARARDCSGQLLRHNHPHRPGAFPTYWGSMAGGYIWAKAPNGTGPGSK